MNQPQSLSPGVFHVGENRMGRYLMSGLFLAFSHDMAGEDIVNIGKEEDERKRR